MWPFIQVAAFPVESMPARETWRQVTVEDPFTALAVGRRHAKDLAMRSRLECVIVGQASALNREIVDTLSLSEARTTYLWKGVCRIL
jgi:hypothetical protein